MKFPGDDNYLRYYTVYFNLVEKYWCNQGMMIPAWLRTVNRNIMSLYQGLSIRVAGLDATEFGHRIWWG